MSCVKDYAKTKKQSIKIMSFFFIFPRAEKELYGSTTKSFWRECLDMVLELPSAEAEIIHISPMVTLVLLFQTSSNLAQLRGNYCKNLLIYKSQNNFILSQKFSTFYHKIYILNKNGKESILNKKRSNTYICISVQK